MTRLLGVCGWRAERVNACADTKGDWQAECVVANAETRVGTLTRRKWLVADRVIVQAETGVAGGLARGCEC